MEAIRIMKITLTMSETEAKFLCTGLNYGTMHIRDHINPPDEPEKQKVLIEDISKLDNIIREAMNTWTT